MHINSVYTVYNDHCYEPLAPLFYKSNAKVGNFLKSRTCTDFLVTLSTLAAKHCKDPRMRVPPKGFIIKNSKGILGHTLVSNFIRRVLKGEPSILAAGVVIYDYRYSNNYRCSNDYSYSDYHLNDSNNYHSLNEIIRLENIRRIHLGQKLSRLNQFLVSPQLEEFTMLYTTLAARYRFPFPQRGWHYTDEFDTYGHILVVNLLKDTLAEAIPMKAAIMAIDDCLFSG